jgi:hypothetical protein
MYACSFARITGGEREIHIPRAYNIDEDISLANLNPFGRIQGLEVSYPNHG